MVNVYDNLDDMSELKQKTCRSCALHLTVGDREVCNPNLYLNIEDKTTVSSVPAVGFKRGCGCILSGKYKNPNSKCPLNKW